MHASGLKISFFYINNNLGLDIDKHQGKKYSQELHVGAICSRNQWMATVEYQEINVCLNSILMIAILPLLVLIK